MSGFLRPYFNTENRVEISGCTLARKYAIFSAPRIIVSCMLFYFIAMHSSILCKARPNGGVFSPILAKIPRLPGKIPLRPNALGCLGISTACLGIHKSALPDFKNARSLFYFKEGRCQ